MNSREGVHCTAVFLYDVVTQAKTQTQDTGEDEDENDRATPENDLARAE